MGKVVQISWKIKLTDDAVPSEDRRRLRKTRSQKSCQHFEEEVSEEKSKI